MYMYEQLYSKIFFKIQRNKLNIGIMCRKHQHFIIFCCIILNEK
jgi:hypothetical protein